MRRFASKLGLLAVALAALGQEPTPLVDPEVRRIGEQLRCMCGSCNYTLTSCNMLSCSGASSGRAKLLALVRQGLTEEQIKAEFVKQYGTVVLTKPPSEGFFLLGWIMPFAAIIAGLLLVWWVIRRFLQPAAAAPGVDEATLARYQERIEKELERID
jgi:cytochrome c-type biogenesis protein CcmH/NrfF